MNRLRFEFVESCKIAYAQIAANRTRSFLTALGVIIGIVAVTLMGTAIGGINTGFNHSMALLGDDILYVSKHPWATDRDDWEFRNRRDIKSEAAEALQTIIDATPRSQLVKAVPTANTFRNVVRGDYQASSVFTLGTTDEYPEIATVDLRDGRFFNATESRGARNVCVLGCDVADPLFPEKSSLDQSVTQGGEKFRVIGVFAKQGSFLGLFSFDNQVVIPLSAFKKFFVKKGSETDVRVKMRDKEHIEEAKSELVGDMRRVRSLLPDQGDDFAISTQDSFKLTRELGTRKALGAGRRTILLQFLIEAVSICFLGGLAGLLFSYVLFNGVAAAFPSFPIEFSINLVLTGLVISVVTGVASGFAPAWSASRLDPVTALRYE